MQDAIIFLLLVLIVLVIVLIVKVNKRANPVIDDEEYLSHLNTLLDQKFSNSNQTLDSRLNNYSNQSLSVLKTTIESIDRKMNHQQEINDKSTKEVLKSVMDLNSNQKQLLTLEESINNLQKTLDDKKARGSFGERSLEAILENTFGRGKGAIWDRQQKLSNGTIVDFLLHAPQPLGELCIDSKFPLEGYLRISNASDKGELDRARNAFAQDVSKHIKDISSKYIIPNQTASQAIMYIPSETIFSEIYAHHQSIVDLAYEKNVWIVSPTTLLAIINLLYVVMEDLKRNEHAAQLQVEINKLSEEFTRFDTRWQKFSGEIEKTLKGIKDINITANKITNRFEQIKKVELETD